MATDSPIEKLRSGLAVSDREFDAIYPPAIQKISEFHFTPVAVAQMAARYLVAQPGAHVVDIGAGAGKFCMIGAASTLGIFTGLEHREKLYLQSHKLAKNFGQAGIHFLHTNILDVQLDAFDAVYLFNPFYENIDQNDPIDRSVPLERPLYDKYCAHIKKQLDKMPVGTRLATYFSYLDEVPKSYRVQSTGFDGKLKFWQKIS